MELPGVDRHARHLILHALQRQIAPAAADAGDLQPRHPARRAVDDHMQTGGGAYQEGQAADQQQQNDQKSETNLFNQAHSSGPKPM